MAPMSGAPARTEPPRQPLARALAIRRQRRVWSRRAPSWDHADMPGLDKVLAAVVAAAGEVEGRSAVDLGCGTGQVALRLARAGAFVVAVDVSPEMIARLRHDCPTALAGAIESVVAPIEDLELASASVDLVVSNYALHHLRDSDKARVVAQAERWLRPGGRLVIGDMMLGRGADPRDRRIIASKVAALARRGPGGWWRIAKNGARFWFRLQERPVSMAAWQAMLAAAGFTEVGARAVVAEAAVVWGTKGLAAPAPSVPSPG